jgi:hypothetical protein
VSATTMRFVKLYPLDSKVDIDIKCKSCAFLFFMAKYKTQWCIGFIIDKHNNKSLPVLGCYKVILKSNYLYANKKKTIYYGSDCLEDIFIFI